MAIINNKKFPTIEAINRVAPKAIPKLPAEYEGTENDDNLAYSLGNALEHLTFSELLKIKPAVPAYMDNANARQYAREYLRFGLPLSEIDSYYDFINVLGKETLTLSEIRYAVSLASKYKGSRLTNALSVVNSIRAYQVGFLERDEQHVVYAKISELENLFALAKVLRSEGIILPNEYLWVASSHWDADEVLLMIEEGLEIRRAMELYTMGFTTMEEIVGFASILPDAWIDRMLNGPPAKEEDD